MKNSRTALKRIALPRLIGKIDNDFNISESDWIPRVAAWVTDALSQMKVLPMEKKRRTLEVSEGVAQFPCQLNGADIAVYDSNGNKVEKYDREKNCGKGFKESFGCGCGNGSIAVIDTTNKTGVNFMQVGTIVNASNELYILNGNNIEINFPANTIDVESYEVVTYHDEYYDCECPYIYDDGLLLEALAWYCLFKYLSRGSKHVVFDLKSNSPVTNPWIQWNTLRPKAAASVKAKIGASNDGWNNFFYNSTFLPRG